MYICNDCIWCMERESIKHLCIIVHVSLTSFFFGVDYKHLIPTVNPSFWKIQFLVLVFAVKRKDWFINHKKTTANERLCVSMVVSFSLHDTYNDLHIQIYIYACVYTHMYANI